MSAFLLRCAVVVGLAVSVEAQAVEVRKLTSADPQRVQRMGFSAALSGSRALIGAPFDEDLGPQAGAAYVFERAADGSWEQTAKLRASDGETGYYFGFSLALDGDLALVGSPRDDEPVDVSGSVYVFERDSGAHWNESEKLVTGRPGEGFGQAIALQGDRAVIGAPFPLHGSGFAFVFERDAAGHWNQTDVLSPSDGAESDGFGFSLALAGERILVGAYNKSAGRGEAYVFELDPVGHWIERATLLASNSGASDHFGTSVALSGERALVGTRAGDGRVPDSGAAYVFERDASGAWLETARLGAADGERDDQFGYAVALSGGRALVGAPGDDHGSSGHDAGSAYAFARGQDGVWRQTSDLAAHDAVAEDGFGNALAVQGDRALVGSSGSNVLFRDAGATFVFDLEPLSVDAGEISIVRGGVQALELDAGSLFAGLDYRVLGSLGGSSPGVTLPGGSVLPLNPDGYFFYTLTALDKPPLGNPTGRLDANGHAHATFTLPPRMPLGLVGRTLNHAFVALVPGERGVRFVSNAQPLVFVP
jgi:hypothetical protein